MPRSLEALIERQIQRSEIQRRATAWQPPAPCVALSRLPGSGGDELGRRLAGRLGYEFYGIELVDRIAQASHVRRQLVEALDERVRVAIDRYASDCFRDAVFRESDYVRYLIHTIAGLGEHGGAVVLGRGAAYILKPERTLRALVVAPRDRRVVRLARERSLPQEEAAQRLAHEEHARAEFLRHHFKVAPDDPSLYDIAVNTESLGMEGAVELVLRAFERRFPGLTRSAAHA